jgi:hypothetical protein
MIPGEQSPTRVVSYVVSGVGFLGGGVILREGPSQQVKDDTEHLDQLQAEIELCESPAVLDLEELDLVDVEAVQFLNACEAKGILLLNCSPYIRKWMAQERNRQDPQT